MLDDFDIDFIVDDEDFWKEKDEPDERDLEPDEESVKTDNLIHDALHKNLVHLEKYDLDQCFGNECPQYFEADTIAEVLDYVKKMKIKAILIFVGGNPQMSEVQEAVDAIKPYCTEECMNGKFLFGCGTEPTERESKFRMLLLFELIQSDSQNESENEFGEDIAFRKKRVL